MDCTRLFLLRHGQSEANRAGRFTDDRAALTPLGRRQARAAAAALVREGLDVLYTSDLPRALESAAPLEVLRRQAAVATPALRERSLGDYGALPFHELAHRQPAFWRSLVTADRCARPPGGESRQDCAERLSPFLAELLGRHRGRRIALLSHRMLLDHLLRLLLGLHAADSPCSIFETDNGGLHELELRGDRVFVLRLNDTRHLAGLESAPEDGEHHSRGRAL